MNSNDVILHLVEMLLAEKDKNINLQQTIQYQKQVQDEKTKKD